MREHDGRKLDHTTLEQLRIRAVRQVEHGAHPEDVAQSLGMTKAAVYAWLANYREGGLEALKARPVPRVPAKCLRAPSDRVERYRLVLVVYRLDRGSAWCGAPGREKGRSTAGAAWAIACVTGGNPWAKRQARRGAAMQELSGVDDEDRATASPA